MRAAEDLAGLIGRTPLVRLGRFAPRHRIYAKCEFLEPLSLKDRPVLRILLDAESDGRLQPGDTLIEATSGNTGMAVASLAASRGYRAILVMSEIQSIERRQVLLAFGAELVLTPAAEGTAGAKRRLLEILEEHPEFFYVGQHQSPSNPRAHYLTTGPEIWEDTEGEVDILVAALGTGGTLCGAGRYLREQKPGVLRVGFEPEEAPFLSEGRWQPHRMMGLAPGFRPETYDPAQVDECVLVSTADAFAGCRELARSEGLLCGISSGAGVVAARRIAERPEMQGKCIVCVLCDTGQRYLSVEGSTCLRGQANKAGPACLRGQAKKARSSEKRIALPSHSLAWQDDSGRKERDSFGTSSIGGTARDWSMPRIGKVDGFSLVSRVRYAGATRGCWRSA